MQTGYYVGDGASSHAITGLGFQPNLVLIKSSTTAGVMVFKSSAMPANATSYLSATADNTATNITFTSDGFTVGTLANVNSANVVYTWTAFTGSDCSATGNFCVGTYTGNATSTRTITTGFQPSMVMVKRNTAVGGHFRTASMAANRTEFFSTIAADTAGNYIRSFASTSFDVGSIDNANGGVYYYVAFKSTAGAFAEGAYTGDGVDGRNITGVGFVPNSLFIKNSTSATTNSRRGVMATKQHYGDSASYTGDAVADSVNFIQALQADGFQLGSGVATNESTITFYWFAFGGAPSMPAGNGTFTMDQGSYTGTGAAFSVTGMSFRPDLVLIKDNAANLAVFRIQEMAGDITAHMAGATADFAGGITSINADGFTIGTSTIVNTSANTYHWQAFGNAYNPDTSSGAADFAVGTYYGNGIDSRDIIATPFQPDLVVAKRNNSTAAAFKTSAQSGDLSGFFAATAESANVFQAFNADGFDIGTNAATNTAGSLYRWFAFKESANFDVGSYTGDAVDNKAITAPGFGPNLVWVKRSTAVAGVQKPSTLAGDNTQYFLNTANVTGRVKSLTGTGFTLGTQTEVNASGGTYRYMAWREPANGVLSTDIVDAGGASVASPAFALSSLGYPFQCSESIGTLGTSSQKIRISNMTGTSTWTTSIAATDGATGLWRNGGNTQQFDYNDGTSSGCGDGGDADTVSGKLRIEPSGATITPQVGCATTNINLGSNQDFAQGTTDAITLVSAASGAATSCYWDITNINLRQTVPASQPADSYNLNFTITTVAS